MVGEHAPCSNKSIIKKGAELFPDKGGEGLLILILILFPTGPDLAFLPGLKKGLVKGLPPWC